MAASGPEEEAAVEVLQASSAPRRLTLPGPTATSSSSPRVVSMVPPVPLLGGTQSWGSGGEGGGFCLLYVRE